MITGAGLKFITDGNKITFQLISGQQSITMSRDPTGFKVEFPDRVALYSILEGAKAVADIREALLEAL